MNKNRLGRSELQVSEIGLGCMSLGTDSSKAISLIHEALDRGVTFLDTADLYDFGRNEELVGEAIRGRRDRVVLATKVGNRRIPGKEGWSWDPSKAYIREAVKHSLARLQTDYIDLYQLHGGTMDDPIDETIEAFEELKREGVIREYGISSIRPSVIREYARRSGIVSVMSPYSLLDRRPEEAVLPLLAENGISLIARGPMAKGILTDAGAGRIAADLPDYRRDELAELHVRLREWARGEGRRLGDTALRFALAHPAVATAIPGASSPEQLRDNVAAGEAPPLTAEQCAALRQLTRAGRYDAHR